MQRTVTIKTPPAKEPVTRDVAKQHARIPHDSDDTLIDGYLTAARVMVEAHTSRALITQTVTWIEQPENPLRPVEWHYYRRGRPLIFPRAPVQAVNSVTVTDLLGNASTIAPAALPIPPPTLLNGYATDLLMAPAALRFGAETVLADGRALRQVNMAHLAVEFVAGYADPTNIPQPIIQAILLTFAFLYEHRGDAVAELPDAVQWLLTPYRLSWV
jgi:uncharacterized phiE125 gp8 family phage protein